MTVRTEFHDRIAVLTLDDGRANALTGPLCSLLVEEIARAGTNADALVLTGAGRMFSAGGDLDLLAEWHTWEPTERRDLITGGPQAVTRALLDAPIPTVAAVNGTAVGAGLDLSLVCDLRLAAVSATFGQAYVHVGVIPGDGGAWLLPRHIGMGAALDLLLTGRLVDAEEARTLGLVSRVCAADALLPDAMQLARSLAARPHQVVATIRRLVYDAAAEPFEPHLRRAADQMGVLGGTTPHRRAVETIREGQS